MLKLRHASSIKNPDLDRDLLGNDKSGQNSNTVKELMNNYEQITKETAMNSNAISQLD